MFQELLAFVRACLETDLTLRPTASTLHVDLFGENVVHVSGTEQLLAHQLVAPLVAARAPTEFSGLRCASLGPVRGTLLTKHTMQTLIILAEAHMDQPLGAAIQHNPLIGRCACCL